MTRQKCGRYLDEIQERMDGDAFKAMPEVMAQRQVEEESALYPGAERRERTEDRRRHRNGYKGRPLKTRLGELALQTPHTRGVNKPGEQQKETNRFETTKALLQKRLDAGDILLTQKEKGLRRICVSPWYHWWR